jgi:parallel beta-helix repeat protein
MKENLIRYLPLTALLGTLAIVLACGTDTVTVPVSPPVPADLSSCTLIADSRTGDDAGDGSADAPYRSITNALSAAVYGDVVCAMQGTYSAPDETFPITVKHGVVLTSVMGSRNTTINGGGDYGLVNAALVLNSGSAVNGFTVLVPPSADTSVIHAGIYTDEYTSAAERPFIVNNVIRDVSFGHSGGAGIVVMQHASPEITGNLIYGNHDGIAVFNSGCPTILLNTIRDNEDNGLYTQDSTAPNMGARNNPGLNTITGNGLRGMYNNSLNGAIIASGNFWEVNCTTESDGTYLNDIIYGPSDDGITCGGGPSNYRIESAGGIIMF